MRAAPLVDDLGSPTIDLALSQLGELAVGSLFFVESVLKDTGTVSAAELLGPRDKRAVTGHLVMFHGLGCGNQSCIQDVFVVYLSRDVVRFLNDPVYGRTTRRGLPNPNGP
jgi:hypothetical protein